MWEQPRHLRTLLLAPAPVVFLLPHLQHRHLTIPSYILRTVFVCRTMISPLCRTGGYLYPLLLSLPPPLLKGGSGPAIQTFPDHPN